MEKQNTIMITLRKMKNIALLVASCSMMFSCDFLEIVPEEQVTLEDATRNPDATLGFMYSCYAGIRSPMNIREAEASIDECAFPPLVVNNKQEISYGLYTPENVLDTRWNRFYESIAQTNLFLRELDNARGCDPADIEEWKAEAYFLLAY